MSFQDFMGMMIDSSILNSDKDTRFAFEILDSDKNGYLTL